MPVPLFKLSLVVVCSFLVFVTLAAIVRTAFDLVKTNRAKLWPTVMGKILSSSVVEKGDGDGGTTYYPAILYQYTMNGVEYRSSVWRICATDGSLNRINKVVKRYPIGAPVTIYVNPKNPADTILDPRVSWFWFCFVFLSCTLTAAYGLCVLVSLLP